MPFFYSNSLTQERNAHHDFRTSHSSTGRGEKGSGSSELGVEGSGYEGTNQRGRHVY